MHVLYMYTIRAIEDDMETDEEESHMDDGDALDGEDVDDNE